MKTQHTQGEWKVSKQTFNYEVVADNKTICQVARINAKVSIFDEDYELKKRQADDGEIANAKLIAAAPDLLEALKQMLQVYQELEKLQGYTHPDSTHLKAIAAINKATL